MWGPRTSQRRQHAPNDTSARGTPTLVVASNTELPSSVAAPGPQRSSRLQRSHGGKQPGYGGRDEFEDDYDAVKAATREAIAQGEAPTKEEGKKGHGKRFQEKLGSVVKKFKDGMDEYDEAYEEPNADCRCRYKGEYRGWRCEWDQLEMENIQQRQEIAELREQLNHEKAKVDVTKRSAHNMQMELDNRELFLGPQATDDEIRARFNSILGAIKTWSTNFPGSPTFAFREEMLPEYQRIFPLCRSLQDLEQNLRTSKKKKRLFVRGWTAYVMSKSLFRVLEPQINCEAQAHDLWLDEVSSKAFFNLENLLYLADRNAVSHRAFNDWRAYTASLLSKASRLSEPFAHAQAVLKRATAEVLDVVGPWATEDRAIASQLEPSLQRIFGDAERLAALLRRQRALWHVRFPPRPVIPSLRTTITAITAVEPDPLAPLPPSFTAMVGPRNKLNVRDVDDEATLAPLPPVPAAQYAALMFDQRCMKDEWSEDEDVDPQVLQRRFVQMIVTPALYKRGNVEGERFDIEFASLPAAVIMWSD